MFSRTPKLHAHHSTCLHVIARRGGITAETSSPFVKRGGTIEHGRHLGDFRGRHADAVALRCVPREKVTVERGGTMEHAVHVGDLRGVPRANVTCLG